MTFLMWPEQALLQDCVTAGSKWSSTEKPLFLVPSMLKTPPQSNLNSRNPGYTCPISSSLTYCNACSLVIVKFSYLIGHLFQMQA